MELKPGRSVIFDAIPRIELDGCAEKGLFQPDGPDLSLEGECSVDWGNPSGRVALGGSFSTKKGSRYWPGGAEALAASISAR